MSDKKFQVGDICKRVRGPEGFVRITSAILDYNAAGTDHYYSVEYVYAHDFSRRKDQPSQSAWASQLELVRSAP